VAGDPGTEPLEEEQNWDGLEAAGDPDAEVVLGCGEGEDPSAGCETLFLDAGLSTAETYDWFAIDTDDNATYLSTDGALDISSADLPATFHLAARTGSACDGLDVTVFAQPGLTGNRRTVINPSFTAGSTSKTTCNFTAGIAGCLAGTTGFGYTGSDRAGALPAYYFDMTGDGVVTDVGFTSGTTWSYDTGIDRITDSSGTLPGAYANANGQITVNGVAQTQYIITAWNVKVGGSLTVTGTKYDSGGIGLPGTPYSTTCKLGGKGTVTLSP